MALKGETMKYADMLARRNQEGYSASLMIWELTKVLEAEGWGSKAADVKARHEVVCFFRKV